MGKAGKRYTTFNKVRLTLFTRSYAHYSITQYLKPKYKINDRLAPKALQKQFFSKHAIPEISRLFKVLNVDYRNLWKSIVLDKSQPLSKQISDKEKIKVYLSVESELIELAIAKRKQTDYTDPDYEDESAMLSIAIERAVGNDLRSIEDDFLFGQELNNLKRKYIYWYYKTAYKYKLPTIRITPFILRLIT